MTDIDYYVFPLSPYCYLAGVKLEAMAAKYGARVVYKPVLLMELFDETGGVRPAKRHPSRMAYRGQELARWAEHTGLPLNLKPAYWPTDAGMACRAIVAAQSSGAGDTGAFVHALLRAVWAEEKDIAEESVVREALVASGFSGDLVNAEGSADVLVANTAEAVARGVFGVPFYWIGEDAFWGQDRLDFVEKRLASSD